MSPLLLLDDVQEITDRFSTELIRKADETLGRRKRIKQPWVTAHALEMCDNRRNLKGKRHDGSQEATEYRLANNAVRTEMRKAKEEWVKQQCRNLEDNLTRNQTKKAFEMVKKLTRTKGERTSVIEDKAGNIRGESKEIAERWREYCFELYNLQLNVDNSIINRLENHQEQEADPPIILEEVKEAIKNLKKHKAPGIDNIPSELISHGGEAVAKLLLRICKKIW